MIAEVLLIAAILGSGLMAGVFFAFSSFVMPALARRPTAEAVALIQAINVTVINWHFLGALFGTALLAMILPWFGNPWAIAGSLLYLGGTIGITVCANVPRNERLAKLGPAEAAAHWPDFHRGWVFWNHLRTLAAAGAALGYTLALLEL